nr:hypothetical protein [Tanacetum cinerariifolium]
SEKQKSQESNTKTGRFTRTGLLSKLEMKDARLV